ncbi:phage terminase large subunit [Acinetobacter indicus]|uniref:phage terminase large subunit n=1 Tax=Acinetobacter indicus TaxID=756892 RepID=UPI0025765C64|nr:phage terminase large subunit [Acinetobacter indicus]MDM1330003.1 phage terminase large subunit [Acinetobacter indicus]
MVKVDFATFYLVYAEVLNWVVPDFHLEVCDFLQDYGTLGLLMMPRGHGKSTILDVYNAWKLYINPDHLILHQGATDPDAYKVSRGTEQVMDRHPLCQLFGVKKARGETQKWWVSGSTDVRHGSIHARGILSNVTGARANEIQNDDVEVPSNIGTPEAREKLLYRLSEQTHILIPGGQKLFVGTPHTHDSLYTRIKKLGAKCLILKMFEKEKRFEQIIECLVDYKPVYIFSGIGTTSKLLKEGEDYQIVYTGHFYKITFDESHYLIDVYSEALWPERFTPAIMEERRRECRTINEWDSQYQLHAKPVGDVRLDPDKMIPYDCEPVLMRANGEYFMMLGERRVVGITARWDPSSGKIKSDISAVAVTLHDDLGNKYWHRSVALKGEVVTHNENGEIIGGQAWQLCDLIETYHIPRVVIETNGIGGFAAAALKGALKARRLRCGVVEHHSTGAKNKRILEAIEGPLVSGLVWVHVSVIDTPEEGENSSVQYKQMRMFNPAITDQEDDYLDSFAGTLTDSPERVGKIHRTNEVNEGPNWRGNSGVVEATLDFEN